MPQPIRKDANRADLLLGAARNCWLALNEDESKIVGRGDTMEDAVKQARQNGVDDPIVIWSPKKWVQTVFSVAPAL